MLEQEMCGRWEDESVNFWHWCERTGWTLHVRPYSRAELAAIAARWQS